jgi:hypothetical protein
VGRGTQANNIWHQGMIIKFSSNLDFDFGIESAEIITDSRQLTKRASENFFDCTKVAKDQTPVHLIAVSAYEATGSNRNSDSFLESDCRKNHSCFTKAGRAVHWHHINKKDSPKYGDIYASHFNEKMKRVELMVGLDEKSTKNAQVLDDLSKGKQVAFSMASKQAFDICSICNHKSFNGKNDRCEHIPDQLGEITKSGALVHMINPDPKWFEISLVSRPAERIGYSLRKLNKQASDYSCVKQAYQDNDIGNFPDLVIPADNPTISKKAQVKRVLLSKLATIEKRVEAVAHGIVKDPKDKFIKEQASKLTSSDTLSPSTLEELRKQKPGTLFKVLADNGIVMGPEDFVKFLFEDRVDKDRVQGMKQHLPDVFSCLDNDDSDKGDAVNEETFEPESGSVPTGIKKLLAGLVGDHSLFSEPAHMRVMRITIIGKPTKGLKASIPPEDRTKEAFDKNLAQVYASYKLAALNYLSDENKLDDDMLLNAVIQNRQ